METGLKVDKRTCLWPGRTFFRCVVGSQGVEHVADDFADGFWDGRQWGQFEGGGLHQLYSVGPFDAQVLKLVVRS